MGCTYAGHKSFLMTTNIGLLIVGLVCTGLGIKMKTFIVLIQIPILMKIVKAVIAAGFFMTLTGISGCSGACYEVVWMLCVHMVGLGIIVALEFGVGVTVMVIKNTFETIMEEAGCQGLCMKSLSYTMSSFIMPSAGVLLTVIIIQALMIYSAAKLFFHFRERPKDIPAAGPTIVVQNVQMQNMGGPPYGQDPSGQQPGFPQPPQPGFPQPGFSQPTPEGGFAQTTPQPGYPQPPPPGGCPPQQPQAGYPPSPQPLYAPEAVYAMHDPPQPCGTQPPTTTQNQPCAEANQPPPPPYCEVQQPTPQLPCAQQQQQLSCAQQQSQASPMMDVAATSTPTPPKKGQLGCE